MSMDSRTATIRLFMLTAGAAELEDQLDEAAHAAIDWELLLALADFELAHPVIWNRLAPVAGTHMPAGIAEFLRKAALSETIRLLHVEGRLSSAVTTLSAGGVECMLLKGAALGNTVYPSFAERPMGDLDILVPADRALDAHATLRAAGWRPLYNEKIERWFDDLHHLPVLTDETGSGRHLEVHTDIFPARNPFGFSARDLWTAATPLQLRGGGTALVPSTVHQLLHVCVHMSWSHLMKAGAWRSLRDVRVITEKDPPEWSTFVDAAVEARAAHFCYWPLRLARTLLHARVPDTVLESLRPRGPRSVLVALERHFASEMFPAAGICPSHTLRRRVWEAAMRPAASGHGSIRPWSDGEHPWHELNAKAGAAAARPLVGYPDVGRWWKYARTFF
jgi:hypothetical protein